MDAAATPFTLRWPSCDLAKGESSLSTGTAGSPSPTECATAPPGSTRTPCPDRSIYRRRATDTGQGGVPQPAQPAASVGCVPSAVPSHRHVTPGTRRGQGHFAGAVSRVLGRPQVSGCTDSPERGGGLAGAIVAWQQPGAVQWAVAAGEAQPRRVSTPLLVVLALQGTERRAG